MKYLVKQGKHKFIPSIIKLFWKKELSARVKFDSSCKYKLNGSVNSSINKLFGFSNGFHHHYSCRFGWRSVDNKIELLAYIYHGGTRIKEWDQDLHLAYLELDQEYTLIIKRNLNNCYFKIFDSFGQNIKVREFGYSPNLKFGYRLNPYFGGTMPAPHNMKIEITYL